MGGPEPSQDQQPDYVPPDDAPPAPAYDDGTVHPPMLPGPNPGNDGNPLLATVPDPSQNASQCTEEGGQCPVPPTQDQPSAGARPPPPSCADPNPWMRPVECRDSPAVDDAEESEREDIASLIPGVSEVMFVKDALGAGGDLLRGDDDGAKQHASNMLLDAYGTIPIGGQLLSVIEAKADDDARKAREAGATPEQAPTFSEDVYKSWPSWEQLNGDDPPVRTPLFRPEEKKPEA